VLDLALSTSPDEGWPRRRKVRAHSASADLLDRRDALRFDDGNSAL
jgi:hypothetical protein